MKKILFLIILLAGCTTYHQTISSYNKIDSDAKTIIVNKFDMTDIRLEFKQVLIDAGFRIYDRDDRSYAARYELYDDIIKDENVRCGLWEDGYTYEIMLRDTLKRDEVFSMQGKGCHENILTDFTALINNRYDEKKENNDEPKDDDIMRAPVLKSDGRTWWGN